MGIGMENGGERNVGNGYGYGRWWCMVGVGTCVDVGPGTGWESAGAVRCPFPCGRLGLVGML